MTVDEWRKHVEQVWAEERGRRRKWRREYDRRCGRDASGRLLVRRNNDDS